MLNHTHVDDPVNGIVKSPFAWIRGWIATSAAGPSHVVKFGPAVVETAWYTRPDLPAGSALGFTAFLDLITLHEQRLLPPAGPTHLDVYIDGNKIAEIKLTLDPLAVEKLPHYSQMRAKKQAFIQQNFKSPPSTFPGCKAPSFFPKDWAVDPRCSAKTDPISAHGYGPPVFEFLRSLPPGAMVLDAGAGFRRYPEDNVVHLEIYDYPSTDVLAIGQDLPFKDNTFDAVLSFAVLEHVDDPFQCARELQRVCKPGGKIMAIVPFLQAEHGYPSHYFNCTRFGLQKLFEACKVLKHTLDKSNHPIMTLTEILYVYACGLPEPTREQFLNMQIKDFIINDPASDAVRARPYVTQLDAETLWKVASGTTAIFEKPHNPPGQEFKPFYPPGHNWFEKQS